MLPKQRMFLDELAALFRKYHITFVYSKDEQVFFESNKRELSFCTYELKNDGPLFEYVIGAEDYTPEDLPEEYTGDENFDD